MMHDGKLAVSAAAAALAGLFGSSAATNLKLQPGEYTVTITYEVQEQRQNEPRIATRCITAGDLGDPERVFHDQADSPPREADECKVRNLRIDGLKISYVAECPNRTVHVEGDISGQGFSVVRTVTPRGNQGVSLKIAELGRRTGYCLAQ